jgi:hypothetical protein
VSLHASCSSSLPYLTGSSWCVEQLTADGHVLNISRSLETSLLEQSSRFVLRAVSCLVTVTLEVQKQRENSAAVSMKIHFFRDMLGIG